MPVNSELNMNLIVPERKMKLHKVILVDDYGEIVAGPAKVVGPIEELHTQYGPSKQIRVYGKKGFVPDGTSWSRFSAIYSLDGNKIL